MRRRVPFRGVYSRNESSTIWLFPDPRVLGGDTPASPVMETKRALAMTRGKPVSISGGGSFVGVGGVRGGWCVGLPDLKAKNAYSSTFGTITEEVGVALSSKREGEIIRTFADVWLRDGTNSPLRLLRF